ncbi:MAG: MATE family efflux transporter [Akkermansia sp.]
MNKGQDLGKGSVPRLMLSLAVPAIISQLVNMLYNIVDRMYIGHMPDVGVLALTGLGLCFPVMMLVSSFSALFGMGGAPLAAIEMGKGNLPKAQQIMGNCAVCLLLIALLLMGVMLVYGRDILLLFGASEQTLPYALPYLQIYALGTVFVQITLGLNLFITTQGFAKYSMMTVIIGAIINIILDPILIYGLDMGVRGAALASVIAQGVSACWVMMFLRGRKSWLRLRRQSIRPAPALIGAIVALGVSPFIMQSTECILQISFNISLKQYGGDLAVAVMTILGSILQLVFMPIQGINQGAQPVVSFNYGAKLYDRVRSAIKIQVATCVGISVVMWVLIELFPPFFIGIFNRDPDVMNMATWALRVYCFGLFLLGIQASCQQSFVALGFAKKSFWLAILRKIILLIPLIFILPQLMEDKVYAVFLAEPIADILAACITGLVFVRMVNKYLREPYKPKG